MFRVLRPALPLGAPSNDRLPGLGSSIDHNMSLTLVGKDIIH